MNRGSGWLRWPRLPRRCSFNEAPIHESGKYFMLGPILGPIFVLQ